MPVKGTNTVHPTRPQGTGPFPEVNFALSPFIVFWEITRACSMACRHCRASAQPQRHPDELTTAEGLHLIDEVAELGTPLLVITGGDPMMRPDLFHLIEHGAKRGLRTSLAPSATRLVSAAALKAALEAGAMRASLSLDGSTSEVHDAFRQTPGSYQRAMDAVANARAVGLPIQINTTVSRYNLADLQNIAALVASLGAVMWDVFLLVPTGRGRTDDMISGQEHEDTFHWLCDLAQKASFDIKTTAAQHYRRVVMQRKGAEGVSSDGGPYPFHGHVPGRSPKGVNDGNGCCFISHIGDVQPSGFLPLATGNVRRESLSHIYRQSPIFLALRDPGQLKGKCGVCEYNHVCGGSRARAYAVTGDYLQAEPRCIYQPPAWRKVKGNTQAEDS